MYKALIQQLKGLQAQEPNSEWKKSNRELLLSQISASDNSYNANVKTGFTFDFFVLKKLPQPLMAVFLIVAIIFGGGFLGINFSQDAVPGDSLYIAKKINEKAKLALTFNEEKKTRLGLEFAGERAKELKELLSEEGNGEKEEKVTKLVNEFKKEIQVAKNRSNLNQIQGDNIEELGDDLENSAGEKSDDSGSMVFSAGLEKEEKGLQISESTQVTQEEIQDNTTEENDDIEINVPKPATSSEVLATSSEEFKEEVDVLKTIDALVERTEELLKKEDKIQPEEFDSLEAAIDTIVDDGEVKGVNEGASSTEDAVFEMDSETASSS